MKKPTLKSLFKNIIKEGITWGNRKPGERLPTLKDYQEAYNKKNAIKEDDIPVAGGGDYHFKSDDIDAEREKISHWDNQGLPQLMVDDEEYAKEVTKALRMLLNLELDGETITYIVNVLGYEASGGQIVGR